MDTTRVVVEKPSDTITVITMDGPARRNAMARSTMEGLGSAFRAAADDNRVRAVVVTGAGGFFSAGADLKAAGAPTGGAGGTGGTGVGAPAQRLAIIQEALDTVHRMPKPVIAAVEGGAVGVAWSL